MNRLLSISFGALLIATAGLAQADPGLKARSGRGIQVDQGNVEVRSAGGFTTAAGAQGLRTGSFTRHADGSASGERNTTLTNPDTGVTFDGTTRYTKGSGLTRSAGCTDAAGKTVDCAPR